MEAVREVAQGDALITYLPHTRACEVNAGSLTSAQAFRRDAHLNRSSRRGRRGAGFSRKALGPRGEAIVCSRMAGLMLDKVEVPFPGMAMSSWAGPTYAAIASCPAKFGSSSTSPCAMQGALKVTVSGKPSPLSLRRCGQLQACVGEGKIKWAKAQVRRRSAFGRRGFALVGDAVGHYHPLTAAGMTLGFDDAAVLADSSSIRAYQFKRMRSTRVPEMLAVALYEVFADDLEEAQAIRRAVYKMWRTSPREPEPWPFWRARTTDSGTSAPPCRPSAMPW